MKLVRMAGLIATLTVLATAPPAHANGVRSEIRSGDVKAGAVTREGHDEYTFTVVQGATFVVSLSETGTHDSGFSPQLEVRAPGQTVGPWEARPYYVRRVVTNAVGGDWTIKVGRMETDGPSGGNYELRVTQVGSGTLLPLGQEKAGTNTRGGFDVYTFTGTAGRVTNVGLRRTGSVQFEPEVYVFGPDGADVASLHCADSCSMGIATGKGTYTAVVWKYDDNDVMGAYSLSVSNAN